MHTSKEIYADSVDAAAEQILDLLKADTRSKWNVIYFHGWEGLGASAVLRAVAQRLASSDVPEGLRFDKIIHIDCLKWEGRRALQRAIAEQLKLPDEVMEMFDTQDEDDDYHGLDQGSRLEIPLVQRAMHIRMLDPNCRFLVIFHNGSSEEIDLSSFGFPMSKYLDNKVLWTFQGRFRLYPRNKILHVLNKTDVFVPAYNLDGTDPHEHRAVLIRQEAAEVAQESMFFSTRGISIDQLAQSFILHILKLCWIGHRFKEDYDLATHAVNYWICDQLQQRGEDDELRQAADAIRPEMLLDVDYYQRQEFPFNLARYAKNQWTRHDMMESLRIHNADMPQDFDDKISVLKLSGHTFKFSSPPFVHCRNLRFLWLDNCHDEQGGEEETNKVVVGTADFFGRLLVLHVLNTRCDQILSAPMLDLMAQLRELIVTGTTWDMGQLQGGRLPNIRKLRVTKSTIICSSGELFHGTMEKMELFEFSGNRIMMSGSSLSMTTNKSPLVETIIINEGCVGGLERISFRGCARLKNVLLRGLFEELRSIDISGTAVKTLDLSAVAAKELDEVSAVDCDKLCAIPWPNEENWKVFLRRLRMETTVDGRSASATSGSSSRASDKYDWYVSVSDARILRSLVGVLKRDYNTIMEVSSPSLADAGEESSKIIKSRERLEITSNASVYRDVTDQASEAPTITQIWPCPPAPYLPAGVSNCYVYIQDQPTRGASCEVMSTSSRSITVPDMICDGADILHVHDSKSITCVPGPVEGSRWFCLRWCRVERCPSLDTVFVCPDGSDMVPIFYSLRTIWCSQLPKVRRIWKRSSADSLEPESIENLEFIHVDLCPRLTHVLPFLSLGEMINSSFGRKLKTLEIVWCGDLKAVFSLDQEQEQQDAITLEFPELKRILLHELPMLHGICGRSQRVYVPKLESIKVRGCWSLTRLPATDAGTRKVTCDCEKEWWDKLKWDRMSANQAPSLYLLTHPRHYKRTMLRTTVLQ